MFIEHIITPHKLESDQTSIVEILGTIYIDNTHRILARYKQDGKLCIGEFKLLPNGLEFMRKVPAGANNYIRYTQDSKLTILSCGSYSFGTYKDTYNGLVTKYRTTMSKVIDVVITNHSVVVLRKTSESRGVISVYDRTQLLFDNKVTPIYSVDAYTSNIKLFKIGDYVLATIINKSIEYIVLRANINDESRAHRVKTMSKTLWSDLTAGKTVTDSLTNMDKFPVKLLWSEDFIYRLLKIMNNAIVPPCQLVHYTVIPLTNSEKFGIVEDKLVSLESRYK